MIDLHTHTFLSDGELSPNELVQRARRMGYTAMAITDHVDVSNIEIVVKEIVRFCNEVKNYYGDIIVLPGVEITHVVPSYINDMGEFAKKSGIKVVVVHGETIVEPVEEGTNKEAIRSEYTDILAHPGLILEEDIILAKENQKYIEITARKGHSLTNGHVAKLCKKHNVKMVLNTDSHSPENLITDEMAKKILKGAGLDDTDIISVFQNSLDIVERYTI